MGGRGEGAVRTHRPQVAPVTLQEPLQEPKWREEEEEGGGSRRKEEEEGGGGEGGGGRRRRRRKHAPRREIFERVLLRGGAKSGAEVC